MKRRRRRRPAKAIVGALGLVLVLGCNSTWLLSFYTLLDVTEPPRRAEALVILGGGAARAERAAEIFSLVHPEFVVLSGSVEGIALKLHVLETAGIPAKKIYTIAADTLGTYDEAIQILGMLQEHNASSALIVTDAFHSRRSLATYNCLVRGMPQAIDLHITGSMPDDRFDHWWEYPYFRDLVLTEWIKLAYYTVRYGITC